MPEDKGKRKTGVCLSESDGVLGAFHLMVQDVSDVQGRLSRVEDALRGVERTLAHLARLIELDEETDEMLSEPEDLEQPSTNN